MSETLNLYQKIQAVSVDVMNIEKDMTVGSGRYSYKAVSDNQVTLQVKRSEQKHKLLSVPIKQELLESKVLTKKDKEGKESFVYVDNIKMTVRFIDLESPDKFLDVESFGKGIDSGDKGFGKASTYARKYALLNAYKIATGEDPDSEKSKELETQTIDTIKVAVINYLNKNNAYLQSILKHFGHNTVEELTQNEIQSIYTTLSQKKLV